MNELTHFGRAAQGLFQEWHALHHQARIHGDDMTVVQVGRPAVSRYHQNWRFYLVGEGPNHQVHDFPSAEMGLKLGGFAVIGVNKGVHRSVDDISISY
jgi:hypothetical protein